MKSFYRFVGLLVGVWILIAPSAGAGQKPESRELIVLLAAGPDVPTAEEVLADSQQGRGLPGGLGMGSPNKVRFGIVHRSRGEAQRRLRQNPDSPAALLERYIVLSYPAPANLEAIERALEAHPWVLSVEENTPIPVSVGAEDPLYKPVFGHPTQYQWGLHTLNFPQAWDLIKGHAYVALVDTGLQVNHPDLRAFQTSGSTTTFEGGNFRPHLSWDFVDGDADVDELDPLPSSAGHGMHTSGIIAATPNNYTGGTGGCWHCSLLMSKYNQLPDSLANGILWSVRHGAQVLNMSLGGSSSHDIVMNALAVAEQRDVAMFASSGNDKENIDFPASDSRVIAVGGTEPDGSFWVEEICPRPGYSGTTECGSNYTLSPGTKMQELVAPAKQILSTVYTGRDHIPNVCGDNTDSNAGYGLCTGTSMSAPYVSALAGLLRSANPLLSKGDVRSLLIDNADRAGSWHFQFGYGVPNAAASVADAMGVAAGQTLPNRLTPLFSLYSSTAGDFFYTTVPQMASAAIWDSEAGYIPQGPAVPGYDEFPGDPGCQVGPCFYMMPSASVYIFTSDKAPYPGAPPLVPLYRMTATGLDTTYTTEPNDILAFKNVGYELDGIEGYIYKRCTPDPSCIPPGAVRLWRLYNTSRDDYAIFPESELTAMHAAGYTSRGNWIGYVYPNADSDGDSVINGFEGLIGTDPSRSDSDCDSLNDGAEILNYPYTDPRNSPGCVPKKAQILSQSVPPAMVAGQTYPVRITLKNAGTLTWSPVGNQCNSYRLGSANPLNNTTWGLTRIELPGAVISGQQVSLNFTVTAPTTAGTHNFQWSMVHECIEWFGDASPNVAVSVRAVKPRFSFTCSGLTCTLNASASTASLGIASYSWSFGDSAVGSGVTTSHAFPASGSYSVTLTITDTQGLTASTSRKVSVTDVAPPPAQSYFTVAPCRLLDTRSSSPLNNGQLYAFNVAGNCGIPATAKAVSFNVGVLSSTGPGHLVFYPGNQSSSPFATSAINFISSPLPRFNNAILRLATNGAGTLAVRPGLYSGTTAHLILDINGYYSEDTLPAPGAQGPFGYQTVTPCRLADTRTTATPLAHGVSRNFTAQGVCGVPAGATVGMINLSAVTPSEGGYIQMFPAGTPAPQIATVRFSTGTFAQANSARTKLSTSTPDITLQFMGDTSATGTTHAALDVYGYFKTDAPLKYRPITPCRLLDTRYADQGAPMMAIGETRTFQVQGNCGVPVGAKAAAVNVVAVSPADHGYLVLYASGNPLPLASVVNYHPSLGNIGNGITVPLSTQADDIAITNAYSTTHVVVDVFGYYQ